MSNLPGWSTNRKIVVFESDDWGSIRMPSIQAFNNLENGGIPVRTSHYNLYDSLENNVDLESLYNVLSGFQDKNGNHPVFTGLCVVANPDFEKIKASRFKEYFYEPFTETLIRYTARDKVLDLWKEGAEKRLFVPQFHGREHLNVQRWMRDLQNENKHTLFAFNNKLWGITSDKIKEGYQAALDMDYPDDIHYQYEVLSEGIMLFEQLMGYKPTFFVPPNGPFNLTLEKTIHECGIRFITLDKWQKEPLGNGKYKTHFRWLGKRNKYGQIYLSRNSIFEPSAGGNGCVDSCLNQIKFSFSMKKPAIISTHRVNYIGSIDEKNRENSLNQLKILLNKIILKWPDVEFLSSTEVGELIEKEY